MKLSEEFQHDILLIVTVALVILFATGLAVPTTTDVEPVIISTA